MYDKASNEQLYALLFENLPLSEQYAIARLLQDRKNTVTYEGNNLGRVK